MKTENGLHFLTGLFWGDREGLEWGKYSYSKLMKGRYLTSELKTCFRRLSVGHHSISSTVDFLRPSSPSQVPIPWEKVQKCGYSSWEGASCVLVKGSTELYFTLVSREGDPRKVENGSAFLFGLGQSQVLGRNLPPSRDGPVSPLQFDRWKEASKYQLKWKLEWGGEQNRFAFLG